MTRFGETKKRELQDESDTEDKNIAEGDQKATFSITRLIDYNSKGMTMRIQIRLARRKQ